MLPRVGTIAAVSLIMLIHSTGTKTTAGKTTSPSASVTLVPDVALQV